MQKIFMFAACAFLALGFYSAACGESEPYVRASIGLPMPENSKMTFDGGDKFDIAYDKGLAFSLATGTAHKRFRQELEIAYQGNDINKARVAGTPSVELKGDAWSLALLFNGYFDIANRTPFTPFVSLGIGFALVEVADIASPDGEYSLKRENDVVFAYQGCAGIGWKVHEKVTIDLAYRYFATLDPDLDIAEMDFASQNAYLGVRVNY